MAAVQRKKKLSSNLALITSVLIGIIVLLISTYVIIYLKEISLKVESQTQAVNTSVSASLFQTMAPNIDREDYKAVDKTMFNAVKTDLVAYFLVKDNKTNKVIYSTTKSFVGQQFNESILGYMGVEENNSYFRHNDTRTYYIEGERQNYTMYLGFYKKAILSQSLEKFTNNMSYIVILAIIFGLCLSHALTKIIITPLNQLMEGTKHFANGDFKHRIPYFDYEEIDSMVNSYNSMADTLSELYESLEKKVIERTEQLNQAYNELKNTQSMMVHSEKMKSLGELVAGITHEINNPVNFIYGNLIHLTNYTNDLIMLIDKYTEYEAELLEEHKKEIKKIKDDIDLAFLKEDLPMLIQSCKEGTERTKNIILDLKNFSRMEEKVLSSLDISKEIDTTLNILHSKYKNRIEIHKEYEPNLPLVESYGGQLNQVFMNILDNAFYAIADKGDVWIRVKQSGENVIIEIEDNGTGVDAQAIKKIFDPFYTTKPVGQGTGLGLSISYRVIKNHNGDIAIESEVGKGTTFRITLPIQFVKNNEEGIKDERQV